MLRWQFLLRSSFPRRSVQAHSRNRPQPAHRQHSAPATACEGADVSARERQRIQMSKQSQQKLTNTDQNGVSVIQSQAHSSVANSAGATAGLQQVHTPRLRWLYPCMLSGIQSYAMDLFTSQILINLIDSFVFIYILFFLLMFRFMRITPRRPHLIISHHTHNTHNPLCTWTLYDVLQNHFRNYTPHRRLVSNAFRTKHPGDQGSVTLGSILNSGHSFIRVFEGPSRVF